MFDFYLNTRIKFGCGARSFLNDILEKEQWARVGVVLDHNLMDLPIIKDLLNSLKSAGKSCTLGECTISEPTYDALENLRKSFSDPALQVIVGLGGGSALDMAKAMAVLVQNREPAIAYRGFDKMTEPVLPIIALPTTAGTGSEITPNASFIDLQEKRKMGINGEAVRPRYALLDPELTLSCPAAPTVSAAADSVVHAVEAFVAKKTNRMARLFAREGFRQVCTHLPRLLQDLGDISRREGVMYGAFLAGIALMHSGTGPAAAMSYPLGVHYGVPHGLGGAFFLPHVVEHNIRQGYREYANLSEPEDSSGASGQEAGAQKFFENLTHLFGQIGIPKKLGFAGFDGSKAQTDAFVKETLDLMGALEQNPVPFGEAEIRGVLAKLSGT